MKFHLVILSIFLSYSIGHAQTLTQNIQTAYNNLETDPQLKYASASLTVLNAKTGEVVFSKNGNLGLASASTLKTVTSATAFHILGADFKYQTAFGYSGTIVNGILNGNLIITGAGDPTLGSDRYADTKESVILSKWIEAIRKAGIKKINGSVIADDRLFGTQTLPIGWIWQDIGNYYGAGPSSLTWRENQFDIIFAPSTRVGEPTSIVKTNPRMPYLQLINEVKTGKPGSGDNVYAYSAPYTNIVYLRGTYGIDLHKTISASVPDPAFEAAFRLDDTLKSVGISIESSPTTMRKLSADKKPFSPLATTLATHNSPALAQIVYWFNQKSINLYGEHLIKTIALKQGKEATTEQGVEVVKAFWNNKLGVDVNAMNMVDGSGLSPATRITTSAIAQILASVKTEQWFSNYYESLPVYNNMKMKSGSISNVLAYAGYQNSGGVPLTFSFIINNYNGSSSAIKQKMFKVLDVLK